LVIKCNKKYLKNVTSLFKAKNCKILLKNHPSNNYFIKGVKSLPKLTNNNHFFLYIRYRKTMIVFHEKGEKEITSLKTSHKL